MPSSVRRDPLDYAVQHIIVMPADFVLRDRDGNEVDEQAFLFRYEYNTQRIRQWYHDTLGGYTFNAAPTLIFRSALTEAQMRAATPNEAYAVIAAMHEADAAGLVVLDTPRRFYYLNLPLDGFEYGGNAHGGYDIGCKWQLPGWIVSASKGARVFGGVRPHFRAESAVAAPVGSAAIGATSSIPVAPGTGHRFGAATFPGGPKINNAAGTHGTTFNVEFTHTLPTAVPFDAVIFPVQTNPSHDISEAVRVTAINGTALTVDRGIYGTTRRNITATGYRINTRQRQARVWSFSGQPEDGSAEAVLITNIVGDTLTVTRGQSDAIGSGTAPRTILAGDRIAVTEPATENFAQNETQYTGAYGHEIGHGLGGKYWNIRESSAFSVVYHDTVTDGPAVRVKDVNYDGHTNTYPPGDPEYPNGGVETYGSYAAADPSNPWSIGSPETRGGYYQHLPHTNGSAATSPPGAWQDAGQPHGSIMTPACWGFPSVGFTADEVTRVMASPYITAQPRPADFTNAGGGLLGGPYADGGGGMPTDGPGPAAYYVQPVVWFASDTQSITAHWEGNPGPTPAQAAVNCDAAMKKIQQWFWDQCDGYTFDYLPTRVRFDNTRTEAQMEAAYSPWDHFNQAFYDADQLDTGVNVTDPTRLHMWITPMGDIAQTDGAVVGAPPGQPIGGAGFCAAANQLPAWGMSTVQPHVTTVYGLTAARLLRPAANDFQAPAFGWTIAAHELGHAFGHQPGVNPPGYVYPHETVSQFNIMDTFTSYQLVYFTISAPAKAAFKTSPFMSQRATRPV